MKKGKEPKKEMKKRVVLTEQLRGIASINYAFKAANIMEKILWASMFLIGILYAIYFTVQMFNSSSSIISKIDIKLPDLNYPAMTICPQGTTKYAIAERLGNYLDGNSDFLEKFPSLKDIASCIVPLTNTKCKGANRGHISYYLECLRPRRKQKPVPQGCQVNLI